MRILLVGHFTPRTYYGILNKLAHGFIRLGHAVEFFDDRAVARASTIFGSRKLGVAPMNRKLVDTCRWFRPDFILLGHCKTVWNRTLDEIRVLLPDVRIAYRNVDWLVVEDNRNLIHQRAGHVDAIFCTTAGEALKPFSGKRAGIHYMPNPVDAAIDTGQAFARDGQPFDVFYAIGGVSPGDTRPAFIESLQAKCPGVKFSIHGMHGAPHIFGAAYMDALARARMGLNHSRDNSQYLYSSDRMAQYMGNGLLTFIDRGASFQELFGEDEAVFYSDTEELAEKIRHFAANDLERRRVAENGWRTIHREWASGQVAGYILACAFKTALPDGCHWPTQAW